MKKEAATPERIDFHTKLFVEDQQFVKDLALKYGTIQNVIEKAIQLLRDQEYHNGTDSKPEIKPNLSKHVLARFMLQDFKMLAVGKKTFLSYITPSSKDKKCVEDIPETPMKKNNALELVEWFYNDRYSVEQLSLKQILDAIKALWEAGNYFTNVVIQDLEPQEPELVRYKMVCYHDFTDKRYGMFWLEYMRYTLTGKRIDASISSDNLRPQSFYFEVERKEES